MTSTSPSGKLFFIVGNSGSGKDSLIEWVVAHWPAGVPEIHVAKRVITRPASPETEDFEPVTRDQFTALQEADAFAFWWVSYDIYYGVRRRVLDLLSQGTSVLVNVSRQIIPESRARFPSLRVIFVRVPLEVTMQRVADRGRESGAKLEARVDRARQLQALPDADFVVDNTGALEEGGRALRDYLVREVAGGK